MSAINYDAWVFGRLRRLGCVVKCTFDQNEYSGFPQSEVDYSTGDDELGSDMGSDG